MMMMMMVLCDDDDSGVAKYTRRGPPLLGKTCSLTSTTIMIFFGRRNFRCGATKPYTASPLRGARAQPMHADDDKHVTGLSSGRGAVEVTQGHITKCCKIFRGEGDITKCCKIFGGGGILPPPLEIQSPSNIAALHRPPLHKAICTGYAEYFEIPSKQQMFQEQTVGLLFGRSRKRDIISVRWTCFGVSPSALREVGDSEKDASGHVCAAMGLEVPQRRGVVQYSNVTASIFFFGEQVSQ